MDNKKRVRVVYDFRKRTKGGFMDAMFLVGIIVTIALWFMILILGGV